MTAATGARSLSGMVKAVSFPWVRRGLPRTHGTKLPVVGPAGPPPGRPDPPKRSGPLTHCVDTMKFMVRFNTDPLVAPLTTQEIQALKQRRRQGEFGPTTHGLYVVGAIGVIALIGGHMLWTTVQLIGVMVSSGDSPRPLWQSFLPILIIIAICATALFMVLLIRAYLRRQRSWVLLARFADANGMRFGIRSAEPRYPGLLFNEGRSRASTLHMFSPAGVLADVATTSTSPAGAITGPPTTGVSPRSGCRIPSRTCCSTPRQTTCGC